MKKSTGGVVNCINGGPAPKSAPLVPTRVDVDSVVPLVPAQIDVIASGTPVSTPPTQVTVQVTVKNFTQKFGRELKDEVHR